MNDNHQDLPPMLRKALDEQPEAARTQAEQVWSLLSEAEPAMRSVLDDKIPDDQVPDDDAAWEDLQRRLDNAPRRSRHRASDRSSRPVKRKRLGGWAVGALAFVFLAVAIWQQQPVTVIASAGEQTSVTLPDGSTVLLNSGTRLQYTRRFEIFPFLKARQRRVWLEGEALFQVTTTGRAFVVETFNAKVEVLGTIFNVRARQAAFEQETRVTIVEGQVRVTARNQPDNEVLLTDIGADVRIAEDSTNLPEAPDQLENIDEVLAWRTQGFAVVDRPVAVILAEIERRYALRIEPEEGLALTDSMSLFYLSGTTPEMILHDLCLAQGCMYRKTSSGFVLAPAHP